MKLVLAIVQDKDADALAKEFIQNDVRATKLATSGGFLKAGNTTFIVGIEDSRVNEVLEIIKKYLVRTFDYPEGGNYFCLELHKFIYEKEGMKFKEWLKDE